jgi:hypothetical protein
MWGENDEQNNQYSLFNDLGGSRSNSNLLPPKVSIPPTSNSNNVSQKKSNNDPFEFFNQMSQNAMDQPPSIMTQPTMPGSNEHNVFSSFQDSSLLGGKLGGSNLAASRYGGPATEEDEVDPNGQTGKLRSSMSSVHEVIPKSLFE